MSKSHGYFNPHLFRSDSSHLQNLLDFRLGLRARANHIAYQLCCLTEETNVRLLRFRRRIRYLTLTLGLGRLRKVCYRTVLSRIRNLTNLNQTDSAHGSGLRALIQFTVARSILHFIPLIHIGVIDIGRVPAGVSLGRRILVF